MEESNNGSLSAEFKHLVRGGSLGLRLLGSQEEGEGGWWQGEPHVTQVFPASLTDPERAKMW